jgi:hypothetical protein
MKPCRILIGVCALGLLAPAATPVQGAWNNVFQVSCFHRKPPTTSAYVAVPSYSIPVAGPCCAPPPPVCTTRYVQRCYYQPVTTYQSKTYYEPVTTYRTSYYYEPVTSYRYSCYYDPCSCSYKQVACPTTSYQLRAQSCPVQSWVQRCCSVPVTTYQQASYWEPVTSCCQPAPTPCCTPTAAVAPVAAPVYAPPPAASGVYAPPPPAATGAYAPPPATPPPPAVTEQPPSTPPPPAIQEQRNGGGNPVDKYYGPPAPPTSYRQPTGAPVRPVSPAPPPPPVRLDRIVVGPDASVEGRVVRNDNTPRPNVQLTFISADRLAPRQFVTANSAGRFRVTLAAGGWMVFLNGVDGTPAFHSRIEVGGPQMPQVTLVSR